MEMYCLIVETVVTMVTGKLEVFGEDEVPHSVFNGQIAAAINNRVITIYRMCVISIHVFTHSNEIITHCPTGVSIQVDTG